jgi:hypothetical protein
VGRTLRLLDSHSKIVLKRQIEATDRQIDELGYQLYGLTTEEIELVESERRVRPTHH